MGQKLYTRWFGDGDRDEFLLWGWGWDHDTRTRPAPLPSLDTREDTRVAMSLSRNDMLSIPKC